MNGWKAFDKGLVCRGKQYEVGKTYEEPEAIICEKGMHYCDNPIDLLRYHDLIDGDGNIMEIARVEDLDPESTQSQQDGSSKKYCTKKLKIGEKVSFRGWVKAAVRSAIVSNRDDGTAALGEDSRLAASGSFSQLVASGSFSQLAASGSYSQLVASGDNSRLAASGEDSRLAASGSFSQLAASGSFSRLTASGSFSQLVASGDNSVVAAIGVDCKAKGALGTWITLAEWKYDEDKRRYLPVCVKTEKVDGKRIKADTWYMLKGGEFVEDEE